MEDNAKINFFEDLPKVNIKYLIQEQIRQCLFAYVSVNNNGDTNDEQKYEKAVDSLWDLVEDYTDAKSRFQMAYLDKQSISRLEKARNNEKVKHTLQVEISRKKFKCIMRLLRRLNWV